MEYKLSPQDLELYQRVDEVLHYLWDPIGVARTPEARNEYRGYLPQVFSLLKASTNGKDIREYLLGIQKNSMGLEINATSRYKVKEIVEILMRYRDLIKKGSVG